MKQDKIFTPLNISYPIQKYSNFLVFGAIAGILLSTVGIIITFKIKSDLAFSPIFGTNIFAIIGVLLSLYAGLFVFRKVGINERNQMRLYNEMIDHELTTINDLWEIIALDGCVATFADNSAKVFLRCEKGYMVSRPAEHDRLHKEKVTHFLKFLLDKNYYIDYYNWRDRDANTAPLDDLEDKLNSNPNEFLRNYGNSVIKFCRELEYQCTDSEVEYFVIASRDPNLSAYLESSVEAATEYLQGSLYEDIQICDIDGIIEFIEQINKIKGINVSEMLSGNVIKTDQKVVRVIKVIGATSEINDKEERNTEEEAEYQKFIQEYEQLEQSRKESTKQRKNLAHQNRQSSLKPIPVGGNNIVTSDDIPIPVADDMPMPVPVNDDMPMPVPVNDDIPMPIADTEEFDRETKIEDTEISDDEIIGMDEPKEMITHVDDYTEDVENDILDDDDEELIEDDDDDELIEDDDDLLE